MESRLEIRRQTPNEGLARRSERYVLRDPENQVASLECGSRIVVRDDEYLTRDTRKRSFVLEFYVTKRMISNTIGMLYSSICNVDMYRLDEYSSVHRLNKLTRTTIFKYRHAD